MKNLKIMYRLIAVILCMSILPIHIWATEQSNIDLLCCANDLAIFPNVDDTEYLTYEEYLQNKEIFTEVITEVNRKVNDSIHKNNEQYNMNHLDYYNIEESLASLGYYKLTNSQKQLYAALTSGKTVLSEENNVSVNGTGINDGKIYYPNIPGMDMYVTYFTYNNNGVIEYMADVMVVLNENDAKSSLVRIFDAVEMYDKVKFSDMADKVIKCTASGIISSFLPTSGSIAVEAIMNLAEPFIPQSHYTNNATLTLKVSSISTISHMWRKTNNKFYFRLATNAATVKESWIFVDTTGSHYYSYNEYYIESPNYRNVSIAANHTESTSFSIPDIKYQTKGFLGIYFTKLTVSPYYAGAPASLAFD